MRVLLKQPIREWFWIITQLGTVPFSRNAPNPSMKYIISNNLQWQPWPHYLIWRRCEITWQNAPEIIHATYKYSTDDFINKFTLLKLFVNEKYINRSIASCWTRRPCRSGVKVGPGAPLRRVHWRQWLHHRGAQPWRGLGGGMDGRGGRVEWGSWVQPLPYTEWHQHAQLLVNVWNTLHSVSEGSFVFSYTHILIKSMNVRWISINKEEK